MKSDTELFEEISGENFESYYTRNFSEMVSFASLIINHHNDKKSHNIPIDINSICEVLVEQAFYINLTQRQMPPISYEDGIRSSIKLNCSRFTQRDTIRNGNPCKLKEYEWEFSHVRKTFIRDRNLKMI